MVNPFFVDYTQMSNVYFTLAALIVGGVLYWRKQFKQCALIFLFVGLIMLVSGVNWFISCIPIVASFFIGGRE